MLKTINYLSVNLVLGAYKLPENVTVIGDKAVCDTKTGASGILIRHNSTGLYSLFSGGYLRTVEQKEAKRFEV